jgi:hypothetical protein
MGTVIAFPHDQRVGRVKGLNAQSEPADVIILPVVRIERPAGEPTGISESGVRSTPGRRRRRRANRS